MKNTSPLIWSILIILVAAVLQYIQPEISGNVLYGGVDEGSKKTTITVVASPGVYRPDDPSIAIGANGYPIIAYVETGNPSYNPLKVLSCGNAACSQGNVINVLTTTYVASLPSIVVGGDGIPLISFMHNGAIVFARCGDPVCSSGNTISTIEQPSPPNLLINGLNSLAIGGDGLPIIAYSVYYNSPSSGKLMELRVAKCSDSTCSGPIQKTVIDGSIIKIPISYIGEMAMMIGADGFPRIAYIYGPPDFTGAKEMKLTTCKNHACSSGFISYVIERSPPGNAYAFPSDVALGIDNNPIIAYIGFGFATQSFLRTAKCMDSFCSCVGDPICVSQATISLPDNYLSYTDVLTKVRGNGLPQVVYLQSSSTYGDLILLNCKTPDCQSFSKVIIEAGTSSVFAYNIDFTIGTDGNPVIVYTNAYPPLLKVAKCHNPNCI